MDYLILGLLLTLIGVGLFLGFQVRELKSQIHELTLLHRSRQSNIGRKQEPRVRPAVVRPRTTRRDTEDLPKTGRMSKVRWGGNQ